MGKTQKGCDKYQEPQVQIWVLVQVRCGDTAIFEKVKVCLVDCNKHCNVIFITIHLFDDNTITEFENNGMKTF